MRRDHAILLLLSLLFTLDIFSQQVVFKTYTVNDGLVANPVRRIFQDSKGFLWLATWDGISKYDGHKFTNYTTINGLSHNLINDFYETEDGQIYLAENNGTTDIIENGRITKKGMFPSKVINQFFRTRDGRVIALTDTSGIYELKAGQLNKISFPYSKTTFNDIAQLNDTAIVLYAPDRTLIVLNSSYHVLTETKETGVSGLSLFADANNNAWVGTSTGLKNMRLNKGSLELTATNYHAATNSFKPPVTSILKEKNGNLWLGSSQGVLRIKPNGSSQHYTIKDGLPANIVYCIFQDKEENVWIGTSMGLAKIVTRNKIEIYTSQHGLAGTVHGLYRYSNNTLLVFSHGKIQQFDPQQSSFKTLHDIEYTSYTPIACKTLPVFYHKNRIFVYDTVTNRFIEKFKIRKGFDLMSAVIYGDKIIIGADFGLMIWSAGKTTEIADLAYRVTGLAIDRSGYVWISTWRDGLFRVRADKLPVERAADFEQFLPGTETRSLLADSYGSIWAGTRYKGVFQITDTGGGFTTTHFDNRQGLTSTWVSTMAEDAGGNIWLGSVLGLDKLIRKSKGFEVFNFSRVNDCFQAYTDICFSKTNELWCTTTDDLVHITDDKTETLSPLPVHITGLSLAAIPYRYIDSVQNVSLKHYENQANFEFTAPGFTNEKQIQYSYRLLGSNDTSWSNPANTHTVSYASLQPGHYRFQARTVGWNGKYGEAANFSFTIRPPYWKTPWFMLLMGFIVSIVLYVLYRYRIQQLMQLQKVRTRLATDLHDDIGATLTNINILSELSKKNLQEPAQARQFLQRITEEVTASGQALDDIIWSVNARNDSMEEIIARMRRYAADLFDSSDIEYKLDLDETVSGKKLGMEQRRDVYLIFKESLNNIYKHADAKNVWIKAAVSQHLFELTVEDDGKGFNINQPTHRNGLKNLHERVKKWKGELNIRSARGKGTVIHIVMPV